jgi:hypothetical protein
VRVWAIGLDNMYWINTESNTVTEEYENTRLKMFYKAFGLNDKPLNFNYTDRFVYITIPSRKKLIKTKSKQSRFIMVVKN